MRDLRASLAHERHLAKNTGSTGSSGSTFEKANKANTLDHADTGTTAGELMVPVVPQAASGTSGTTYANPLVPKCETESHHKEHDVSGRGTTGTSGTTENSITAEKRDDPDNLAERAAVMEYEAGMPRAWADAFATIVHGPNRFADNPARWQSVVDGALVFADQWAGKAHSLGWTVDELFGLDPVAPAARLDHRGLAFLLGNGSRVVAIDRDGADIITGQGSRQRYYRQRARAA